MDNIDDTSATCEECGRVLTEDDRDEYEHEAGFAAGYPRICERCAGSR